MGTYRQSSAFLILASLVCVCTIFGLVFLPGILLSYTHNKIELGEKMVTLSRGVVTATVTDVPYGRINSVSVRKGQMGSLTNSGTVVISTGNDVDGIVFKNIERPEELKRALQARMA